MIINTLLHSIWSNKINYKLIIKKITFFYNLAHLQFLHLYVNIHMKSLFTNVYNTIKQFHLD